MKIDIRVVYGKSELRPDENNWLESMTSIRTSFCPNLHAKCYMSERAALLTSMNLYEFSQVNNHEMGVLVDRSQSEDLYRKIYDEAMRIIRPERRGSGQGCPGAGRARRGSPTRRGSDLSEVQRDYGDSHSQKGHQCGRDILGVQRVPQMLGQEASRNCLSGVLVSSSDLCNRVDGWRAPNFEGWVSTFE